MAIHRYSSSYEEEDYIDIELFSSPNFFCYPITSPSPTRDFEFQLCQFPIGHKPSRISPADELFFNGKLLPLHIPPRLKMLQNLIQNPSLNTSFLPTEISVGNPAVKPNECLFQLSAELHSCFINYHPLKKSNWTDKLKPSLLAQKIKSSTSYLKSLFTKSGDEFSCTRTAESCTVQRKQAVSSSTDYFENLRYMKVSNKCPFKVNEDNFYQKKSKSIISSSSLSSNSSSSTFSFSSSNDLNLMKRSRSSSISNSEIENSIEGAIAYCKKSYQQHLCSTEAGVSNSLPVSAVVACGDN